MTNPQKQDGERVVKTCSFCGKREDEVDSLAAGPAPVFICDECLDLCRDIIAEELAQKKRQGKRPTPRRPPHLPALSPACSFCGKSQDAVDKLVAGPKLYICDGCVRRFSAETSSPTS